MSVVEQLSFLQIDPTAAVAPSAELVLWSRLGDGFETDDLRRAVEEERLLFEHQGQVSQEEPVLALLRPMSDLPLYMAEMGLQDSGWAKRVDWMEANQGFRRRILDLLAEAGPLPSKAIPDTAEVSWESTGWTNDRNVTQMLQFLARRGDVAVSGRRGRQRLWDLGERVYPSGVKAVPLEEAWEQRHRRILRSLGLARPKYVGEVGEPVEVEGTQGEWRLDPEATYSDFEGRTALLSPFDRLIHDRVRAREIFDFDYTLEMYKPKEQRRWGYFALPILHGDRLIGKADITADRKGNRLVVNAVHQDSAFSARVEKEVAAEVESLASWLGLSSILWV